MRSTRIIETSNEAYTLNTTSVPSCAFLIFAAHYRLIYSKNITIKGDEGSWSSPYHYCNEHNDKKVMRISVWGQPKWQVGPHRYERFDQCVGDRKYKNTQKSPYPDYFWTCSNRIIGTTSIFEWVFRIIQNHLMEKSENWKKKDHIFKKLHITGY